MVLLLSIALLLLFWILPYIPYGGLSGNPSIIETIDERGTTPTVTLAWIALATAIVSLLGSLVSLVRDILDLRKTQSEEK